MQSLKWQMKQQLFCKMGTMQKQAKDRFQTVVMTHSFCAKMGETEKDQFSLWWLFWVIHSFSGCERAMTLHCKQLFVLEKQKMLGT